MGKPRVDDLSTILAELWIGADTAGAGTGVVVAVPVGDLTSGGVSCVHDVDGVDPSD